MAWPMPNSPTSRSSTSSTPRSCGNRPSTVNYYRSRLLRELPAGARITGLSLKDTTAKTEIFGRQLADGETWDQALAKEPEARRTALLGLLEQLGSLRAKSFVLDSFPPAVEIARRSAALEILPRGHALARRRHRRTDRTRSTLFFTERHRRRHAICRLARVQRRL